MSQVNPESVTKTIFDNELLHMYIEFISDAEPFLHLTYRRKPTLSEYKWTKAMKEELLITLGVFGIEYVFAHVPKNDKMVKKWVTTLGFEYLKDSPVGEVYYEVI